MTVQAADALKTIGYDLVPRMEATQIWFFGGEKIRIGGEKVRHGLHMGQKNPPIIVWHSAAVWKYLIKAFWMKFLSVCEAWMREEELQLIYSKPSLWGELKTSLQ